MEQLPKKLNSAAFQSETFILQHKRYCKTLILWLKWSKHHFWKSFIHFLTANTTEWNCFVEAVNKAECRSLGWQAGGKIWFWKLLPFCLKTTSKLQKCNRLQCFLETAIWNYIFIGDNGLKSLAFDSQYDSSTMQRSYPSCWDCCTLLVSAMTWCLPLGVPALIPLFNAGK